MKKQPTRALDSRKVIAPDGIAVHPIELPGLAGLSLAEGRLPPGRYGVHAHRTIEQVTYVLRGRLRVTMRGPGDQAETFDCLAGDTICTPPLTTLSYENPGPEEARVLFICAPPYPPDDGDTIALDAHRPLTSDELARAAARQLPAGAEFHAGEARQFDGIATRLTGEGTRS